MRADHLYLVYRHQRKNLYWFSRECGLILKTDQSALERIAHKKMLFHLINCILPIDLSFENGWQLLHKRVRLVFLRFFLFLTIQQCDNLLIVSKLDWCISITIR